MSKQSEKHHCPTYGCLYAVGSERYFASKKFLNQHIAKVHAEKKYNCSKCHKGFGLDWWRKHHEETCGQEWICDCGAKYYARESLLTHSRRTQHQLPDHVLHTGKKKASATITKANQESPVVVIVQPIIQNLTCIQPVRNFESSLVNLRPILPKRLQPTVLSLPLATNESLITNTASVLSQVTNNLLAVPSQSTSEDNSNSCKNVLKRTKASTNENFTKNTNKFQKTAVETQTSEDTRFLNSRKTLHSQASQCSGRIRKTKLIESTHTQTAESTVVRMKKKSLSNRSKKKSVAITTESNMLTFKNLNFEQSIWPGMKDFIFQSGPVSTCSTSTQTSDVQNKVLRDSQTLTDDDFFNWGDSSKQNKDSENSNSFEMLSEITADDSLTLPNALQTHNLHELSVFSTNSSIDSEYDPKSNPLKPDTFEDASLKDSLSSETCSIFPNVFKADEKLVLDTTNLILPTSSDIHTQTVAPSILDYNLLANMETQTTDEFSFSDLEFLDTETQTPWEDFPNIEDSFPLPADQLSIEIQTDFSSFSDGLNQDPYEFLNGMDMQNIIGGCSVKETTGVNTETQTNDKLRFPQFTNSESQTLDISQFMFE